MFAVHLSQIRRLELKNNTQTILSLSRITNQDLYWLHSHSKKFIEGDYARFHWKYRKWNSFVLLLQRYAVRDGGGGGGEKKNER